jgi:chemotaxis protein methyltransferase CheR
MSSLDQGAMSDVTLSPRDFARFAEFITTELGIKMSEAKVPMLQSRLMRRLRVLNFESIKQYQEYLFNSPSAADELVHFIDAVTTNKTDFFREPKHFEYLVNIAMPEIVRVRGGGPGWQLKLWCAGCSSGEEPYPLAMVLGAYAKDHPGFDFHIFATDISTRMLDHAKAGIYAEERIKPVDIPLRRSYLLRSNDPTRRLVRIVPELRDKLSFRRLNFMDADYGLKDVFDVIFFRNVMIYFDKATQEAVIKKQCRHLRTGGYLFVGHSESLAGLNIPVTQTSSAIFRKGL